MKSFDTELKKYAEKVRLKAAERRELRERILSYMEYHPLPKKREQLSKQVEVISEPFTMFHINALYARIGGVALMIIFLVGAPILAERSVPGDALYIVKTEVNEAIRRNLADTPYKRVEYETKLIERRIAEARLLANEGRLTDDIEIKIAQTVRGHANAAQKGIEEIRARNADEGAVAEISFESALQVQLAVLDVQQAKTDVSSTAGILNVVSTVHDEIAANRGTSTPSYEGLIARVEQESTRAYELFTAVKSVATPEEVVDIERRLQDSDRKILEARAMHGRGEEGAISELTAALGVIKKLITFMTDIDVRNTVSLEILVPVVLTKEERIAAVEARITDLNSTLEKVEERTGSTTDSGVFEKVKEGIDRAKTLIESSIVLLATDPPDIAGAEASILEAEALVHDIDTLTGDNIETSFPEIGYPEETTATGTPTSTPAEISTKMNELIGEESNATGTLLVGLTQSL